MRISTTAEESFDTKFQTPHTVQLGGGKYGLPADEMIESLEVVIGAVKRVTSAMDDVEVEVRVMLVEGTGIVTGTRVED